MSKELQFDNGQYDIDFCAKCGGVATVNNTELTEKDEYLYWIECSECNNRSFLVEKLDKAVNIWNNKQEKLVDE